MSEKNNVVNFSDEVAKRIAKEGLVKKTFIPREGQFSVSQLDKTMSEEEKRIAQNHLKYFYVGNDFGLINKGFDKFKIAGNYDFNNPPLIMREDYSFVLSPELFANILETVADTRGDGKNMWHAQYMLQNYDVFCVRNPGDSGPEYETFFNAQLLGVSEEEETATEYSGFYVGLELKIKRPLACVVAYQDRTGKKCIEELHGDWCRYFLQGYEATRAKPFWENVGQLKLQRAKNERKKRFGDIWSGKLV